MNFGEALEALKAGGRVARGGWNGKSMWIQLQSPTPESKMKQPYLFIVPVGGEPVPWVASQPDLLGDDWVNVEMPNPGPA